MKDDSFDQIAQGVMRALEKPKVIDPDPDSDSEQLPVPEDEEEYKRAAISDDPDIPKHMRRWLEEGGTVQFYDQPEQDRVPPAPRSGENELMDALPCLAHDIARLAAVLKSYLEYTRVHAISGYKLDRCRACDVPHLSYRPCPCPHHQALELLTELGVEVER